MFGFHKRSRSLIPVADLEKMEKNEHSHFIVCVEEQHIEDEDVPSGMGTTTSSAYARNRTMIYLLFLAEAIVAASFSSQIAVLTPSTQAGCYASDALFLRSILESAYMFGSTLGILWGWTSDRWGRRKTAISGMVALSLCSLVMTFVRSFAVLVTLRFIAGAVGSSVTVAGLTMLADMTHGKGSKNRVAAVARLPFVVVAGSFVPLAANTIREALGGSQFWVLETYPGLVSQMACGTLVIAITAAEIVLLKETLPYEALPYQNQEDSFDTERLGFMSTRANESSETLDSDSSDLSSSTSPPSPFLSTSHMLSAPAIAILLASFSVLLLHSSSFDRLLPQLGRLSSHESDTGIPCSWLDIVTAIINALATLHVMRHVPRLVSKTGTLSSYRSLSLGFAALYITVPIVGVLLGAYEDAHFMFPAFTGIVMSVKAILANSAQVVVTLLILSAAPDATSTGKMVGVMYIGHFFSALAVVICGLSYYLSDESSLVAVNGSLWGGLVAIAAIGVAITWKLREKPRVGTDIPEECLAWEDMFDCESDHGLD